MRQISLFPSFVPDEAAPTVLQQPPPSPEEPEPVAWPAVPEVLPGQLHLFSDRAVRLGRARAALAEARFEEARRELKELKKRFPDDPFFSREGDRVARLHRRFTAALASAAPAAALLTLARSLDAGEPPWSLLRVALLRRVAGELGDHAELEGEPAGFYLLEAGAIEDARAQLARAVVQRPAAHTLFLLGDAARLAGARLESRRAYFAALLVDPFDRALAVVRDDEVRALPDVARDELGLEEAPVAWCAPVGVVTGVLPWPAGTSDALIEAAGPGAGTEGERRALDQARAFVEALVASASPAGRGEGAVAVRRRMKQLSPALFAAYMDRVVRARRG